MKKVCYLFLSFVFFFMASNQVNANSINKISMDIKIDAKGNANITEVWSAYLNKGTEGYHPYYDLGNSTITMNSVSDDKGNNYTLNSNWNVDDSFSTKKYHYGIYKTGNETDLCWGISDYGNRVYTINYTINNFIYNTTDGYQILYWQLIPYSLSSKPDSVYIKVSADNKFSDSLDVWGFGNYGGTCYVYDGYIEMQSKGSLSENEYMTMLVKFPANTFTTTNNINKSFDAIYNQAEEGTTNYNKDDDSTSFWPVIASIVPWLIIVVFIAYASSKGANKIKNKVMPKNVLPFRDLPCKDDLRLAYLIANEYHLAKDKTDYLGTLLLKWIKNDNVTVATEETGVFKNKNTTITMLKAPTDPLELEMYNMMLDASKDSILENNEFKKYCEKNYTKVLAWFDKVINDKITSLANTSYINVSEKRGVFGSVKENNATPILNEKAKEMAGLKLFFKEFSSMDEKRAIEVKMWREYLMYAQLLGMAKEVAKEFQKLYPDVITENNYNDIILINNFSYMGVHAASLAQTRANNYTAGGGGFSAGGGGGGSFGGGGGGGGFR